MKIRDLNSKCLGGVRRYQSIKLLGSWKLFFFFCEKENNNNNNNLHSLAFSFFNTIFFSFLITLDSNKTHVAENYVLFNGPPVQFKNAVCITLIDITL